MNNGSINLNIAVRESGETICKLIDDITGEFQQEKHRRIILNAIWKWLKNHPLAKKPEAREPNPSPPKMSRDDVEGVLGQCEVIVEMIEDLPPAGWDFGESVAEKVHGIAETIEETGLVTDGQQNALDNMEAGIEAWMR